MIRQGLRELRLHPGRFAAVLSAIILSVGFLALTQTFVATETTAVAKRQAVWATKADIAVSVDLPMSSGSTPEESARFDEKSAVKIDEVIKNDPGVEVAERLATGYATYTDAKGDDHLLQWTTSPANARLQWAKPVEGRLPAAATEVVIPRDLAKQTSVRVGDTIETGKDSLGKLTIVGLSEDRALFASPVLVGADVAHNRLATGFGPALWAVDTKDGQSQATIDRLRTSLTPLASSPEGVEVDTADHMRQKAMKELTKDVDAMSTMLSIFGAIALLVGAILITTTFTILMAQRRRQTGLLRAVGASRRQVFRRYLGEAIVIGAVGSVLGVVIGVAVSAVVSATITRSLGLGLEIPWARLAIIAVIGTIVTVIAAVAPLRRAMSVKPLEALQPMMSQAQARRHRWVLTTICSLLFLVGVGVAFLALSRRDPQGILLAVVAAVIITIAVLSSASLYIPQILRGVGALFSPLGPTVRLAALNSRRNPGRAGATATALMLAVGLITTLQVGQASLKATANDALDARYPMDLIVQPQQPTDSGKSTMTSAQVEELRQIDGVESVALLQAVAYDQPGEFHPYVLDDGAKSALSVPTKVTDGQMAVNLSALGMQNRAGTKVEFGKTTVTLVDARIGRERGAVTPGTLQASGLKTSASEIMIKIADDTQTMRIAKQVNNLYKKQGIAVSVDGGALMKAIFGQVLDTLLLIVLALLGVATLIALLGVGNTLGLSVLERTRESALLRALGLQRGKLRLMLLVEALLLSAAGTLVGLAFGFFFGWLGITTLVHAMKWDHVTLAVSWPILLGVIAIALVAGVLGSILPGRRAAKAAPVEALADVG